MMATESLASITPMESLVKNFIDLNIKSIISDPNVDRSQLEQYAAFPLDVSPIHLATKKASICSLDKDVISFLFHDTGYSERAPFHGNSKLKKFVACHTILAFNVYDIHRDNLDVDKANHEKASVGEDIEKDDGLMTSIFEIIIQEKFSVVWNHRKEYANSYHSLLMNNNFVLQLLEEFKPTSPGLLDKSDMLAFLFAKLKALDLENAYYPKVHSFYEKLFSQYSIQNIWKFAKLAFFDSTRFTNDDFKYAREHNEYKVWASPRQVFKEYHILDAIRKAPFDQYRKEPHHGGGDDCIIL
ncbi:hypothetical protein C9374_008563 [Naegleria lovaniensis]|uniref:Uncharacterized protein n=1 Tax=Naegleria lovaniensis TaxID=51637 RepID=A0AA88GIQ2_NAELO|nr:uncharacterized protein C9374_008563 [Naegleria lovaniensis]KAG2377941.1 hypothetical protein C9374_008563 [Naegleria lovaniensis]